MTIDNKMTSEENSKIIPNRFLGKLLCGSKAQCDSPNKGQNPACYINMLDPECTSSYKIKNREVNKREVDGQGTVGVLPWQD